MPDTPNETTAYRADAAAANFGDLTPGTRIGAYEIQSELGKGGMGTVYRARHWLMERIVALKVIRQHFTANPILVERFRREIKAAARLDHPNIVIAYDADQVGDTHFLVMEYIDGQTLTKRLRAGGPLPIRQACEYARQTALALQHAHERGMVHRDVKPDNLMLALPPQAAPDDLGSIKVLDFGLASLVDVQGGSPLTGSDVMLGTPDYIAPEQISAARSADARADIYSLGCSLYELLAGRPPFAGTGAVEKMIAHLEQDFPPLQQWRPEVPVALNTVIARMTAKNPADRYQTAAQVATALTPFCAARSPVGEIAVAPLARPGQQTVSYAPLRNDSGPTSPFAELSKSPLRLPAVSRMRGLWGRWPLMAVLALLLASVVVAGAVLLRSKKPVSSEIVMQTDDPNIQVVVREGGTIQRILDPQSKQTWEVNDRNYELSMADGPGGLRIELAGREPFILHRADETGLTVRREQKIAPVPIPIRRNPNPRPIPPTPELTAAQYRDRGKSQAEQGRWVEASTDFAQAIQRGQNDVATLASHALTLLAANDRAGYRAACAALSARHDRAISYPDLIKVVAALTALPDAAPDLGRLVPALDRMEAERPGYCGMLHLLGALQYRAGNLEEAYHRLDRAIAAHPGTMGLIRDRLFLAMIFQRRGDSEAAREWLTNADREMVQDPRLNGQTWEMRIVLPLLRREAAERLGWREGEHLHVRARSSNFQIFAQDDMKSFRGVHWSQGTQMLAKPVQQGAWADLEIPIPADGTYRLVAHMTLAPDYGVVRFLLNGHGVGPLFDGYNSNVVSPQPVSLGTVELKKGIAILRVEAVAANPNARKGCYYWGLDRIDLNSIK